MAIWGEFQKFPALVFRSSIGLKGISRRDRRENKDVKRFIESGVPPDSARN
jgi:hypothetical protein